MYMYTRSKSVSPALPAKYVDADDVLVVFACTYCYDRLVRFRWVIPAKDQIVLKMKFISDEVGQIDQVYICHI